MTSKNVKDAAISPKQRVIGRPFVKGVSGNPSGRPGGYEEFRKLCKEASPEAVAALKDALSNGDASAVAAARVLLEYAWGKPSAAPEDLDAMAAGLTLPRDLSAAAVLAIARGEKPE